MREEAIGARGKCQADDLLAVRAGGSASRNPGLPISRLPGCQLPSPGPHRSIGENLAPGFQSGVSQDTGCGRGTRQPRTRAVGFGPGCPISRLPGCQLPSQWPHRSIGENLAPGFQSGVSPDTGCGIGTWQPRTRPAGFGPGCPAEDNPWEVGGRDTRTPRRHADGAHDSDADRGHMVMRRYAWKPEYSDGGAAVSVAAST